MAQQLHADAEQLLLLQLRHIRHHGVATGGFGRDFQYPLARIRLQRQQRHVEQQVKLLFDLAAKNGLQLAQGEYKSGYDKASRVATYQVTLPLKGSYAAVWQFALQALRAMPFASLDELSFRREQIADTQLEARLRLTFYLADSAGEAP